jgi:hypothetical protein
MWNKRMTGCITAVLPARGTIIVLAAKISRVWVIQSIDLTLSGIMLSRMGRVRSAMHRHPKKGDDQKHGHERGQLHQIHHFDVEKSRHGEQTSKSNSLMNQRRTYSQDTFLPQRTISFNCNKR